jgi:hypothetical protein
VAALSKCYPPVYDARRILLKNDLESRFKELTLKACDIVDLANLPEDDRHLATRELELRRLYVSLRMQVEQDLESMELRKSRHPHQWEGPAHKRENGEKRVSLGEQLKATRRLVVLGDPRRGKSTLLRWLTTAFLLRINSDPDWRDVPDVATLPEASWLPILVRCRDCTTPCVS